MNEYAARARAAKANVLAAYCREQHLTADDLIAMCDEERYVLSSDAGTRPASDATWGVVVALLGVDLPMPADLLEGIPRGPRG